jgi:transcriptional regulator
MRLSARLKGNLDLLLLAVLRDGPAHGYAIISALRERSDGAFDLAEGTIYPALHQLEAAGHVTSRWDDTGARRRRVYSLTARGRRELAAERERWHGFARGVQAIVGVST